MPGAESRAAGPSGAPAGEEEALGRKAVAVAAFTAFFARLMGSLHERSDPNRPIYGTERTGALFSSEVMEEYTGLVTQHTMRDALPSDVQRFLEHMTSSGNISVEQRMLIEQMRGELGHMFWLQETMTKALPAAGLAFCHLHPSGGSRSLAMQHTQIFFFRLLDDAVGEMRRMVRGNRLLSCLVRNLPENHLEEFYPSHAGDKLMVYGST